MMLGVSKTTVQPITVTITGDPPVEIRPATNTTRVQPIAVTIVGSNQTINVEPAT
jgi:hypothetical protein